MQLDKAGVDAQGIAARSAGRDAAAMGARGHRQAERILILESGRAERNYWGDLWFYRELFAILAWRDFAIRYKQTVVGVAWAIIRPFLTVIILTVIFGRVAKLPSDGSAPYLLVVFSGTLPWFLVTTIVGEASNSLVTNANLIGKVYFPRLIVPSASVFVALVDFTVTFALFLCVAVWFESWPDWRILFLPFFVALAVLAALGPSLLLAAMNVKYRDFRYIIPFMIQFGLYVSPVGFSSSVVPREWRLLYSLNPMVGVIDGFRWCLLHGSAEIYVPGLLLGVAVIAIFLACGIGYFRRTERTFADLL
jgi:lipopolysaccharide transport system permease protein